MNGLQSIEMPMFLFYLHVSTYFQQAMLGKTYVVPRQSFFSPPPSNLSGGRPCRVVRE